MSNLLLSLAESLRPGRVGGRYLGVSVRKRLSALGLTRHLIFGIATLFVVLVYGYHFGTYDQAIHIPSLKKFADPSLYPGDAFMELRFQHYSYFWLLFVPFYKLGVLEVSMFLTHIVVTYLTFWSLWLLSDTLFHNRLTNVMSVLILALPHAAFGGWTVFEFSLLNRTFVLPFLLFTITLYLKRRIVFAFALLGLMYNLHALSANFVLAMFLFDAVFRWRSYGLRTLAWSASVFVVAALPVIAWRIAIPGSTPFMDPEWLAIVAHGMLLNTYYLFAPFPYIWAFTASGLATFGLYLVGRWGLLKNERNTVIDHFMLACLAVLAVEVITVQWLPMTVLVEAQLVRAGVWAMIFGYLIFSHYAVREFQLKHTGRFDTGLGLAALAFPFAFVPLIVWALRQVIRSRTLYRVVTSAGLLGAFGLAVMVGAQLDLWYPGVYVYAHPTLWYQVQIWARDHTPREARFITPPQIWSYHEADWRVFSERSTVVSVSELGEIAFAPGYLETWKERMAVIAPGAVDRMGENALDTGTVVAQAYYSLSDQAVLRAACTYGASFLVSEKPHLRKFPVVYKNKGFVVYALSLYHCGTQR